MAVFGDTSAGQWRKKRKKEEADLDITPMIDVTFLLLIFFMVTSTMQKKDHLVPSAETGKNVDASAAATIEIKMPAEGEVELVAGGETIDISGVKAFVQERVDSGVTLFIIKADKRHTNGLAAKIEKQIAEVKGAKLDYGVRNKKKEAASKLGGGGG